MEKFPRLVIAGVRGGSGKTTLSLGLITALRSEKGLKVIPFKKGPDYIDAGWLAAASENPCYNLDPFLIPKEKIMDSFMSHFTGDIAVIEGNRGLYDGVDAEGSYSTATLAKLLRSPVILIIDCTKMTKTAAAVVLGCMNLDREVSIKGVVLNHVSGSRHESVVRSSIERYCSLPVLGAIPRWEKGTSETAREAPFPERHMGLMPYQEHPETDKALSSVRDIAKRHLDLDRILEIAQNAEPLFSVKEDSAPNPQKGVTEKSVGGNSTESPFPSVRVGVIRDSAFQFYYPENLEELRKGGAELIEISSIGEKCLPDVDALYIGGGFPETHAIALSENAEFRSSLRSAIMEGLPVYAECGGLMFLGKGLMLGGRLYPMTGIFPLVFSLEERPQAHGYTIVEVVRKNPFYAEGTILRGHEFHYSRPLNAPEEINGFYYAFKMKRGQGIHRRMDGLCFRNVFATYTHLHAYGAEGWAEGMVRCAAQYKRERHTATLNRGRWYWRTA